MPLEQDVRDRVLTYCDRHLPSDAEVAAMFDFIDSEKLKERVEAEFYAARYIYKLGEALSATEERLHAHVKFQIVQYASIYEAIIIYLLWEKYANHPAVTDIEFHTSYKKSVSLPLSIQLNMSSGEEIVLCVETRQRTPRVSIKFDDKVDAATRIGFLDKSLGEEIKTFYRLRNAIHLDSAIKNEVKYELDSSLLAYRRMLPFTRGIRSFLQTGRLPKNARPKQQPVVLEGMSDVATPSS